MPKRSQARPSKGRATENRMETYRPGMPSRTDWARVDRTTDEEIRQQIAADPDTAPEFDESWMADAEILLPGEKTSVTLRLDNEVLNFFKAAGRGYQTRMNAVLKSYVRANRRAGKAAK